MKALARSPTPVRQSAFRARRTLARVLRRRREARGDFTRSYPALPEIDRPPERGLPLPEIAPQLERPLTGPGGFFVEAGGNDGFTQSNTYALERRHGWRGILVEPVPELARACALERPGARVVRAALVAEDTPGAEVTLRFGGLMTLIAESREA